MKLQQHMYKCIEREKIEALMFPNGAVRPEIGTCYSRVYYCWDGRPWFPLGNILLLFSLFPFQTWKCLIWKILLNKRITGCFIYILDSSNSSSFTFWSSQFGCSSRNNLSILEMFLTVYLTYFYTENTVRNITKFDQMC